MPPNSLMITSELAASASATVVPSFTLAPEAFNVPVTLVVPIISTSPVWENESPTFKSAIAPAGVMDTMNAAISAYVEYFT